MATHSSILAWRILWQRSLAGFSPWGRKESNMTKATQHAGVFIALRGRSLVVTSAGCSLLLCKGFSMHRLYVGRLQYGGMQALEHRLHGCGTHAQFLRDMWNLPGPRVKPMSPALQGQFLSTLPLGNSLHLFKNPKMASHCSKFLHDHH